MFYYLVLLFTIVPMVELYFLIRVGQFIGAFNTIMLVIGTGVLGAHLARLEGLRVFFRVQEDLQRGAMPTESLIDGVMILIGAVLLITPGILTDAVGFCFVIPVTRALCKGWLKKRFQDIIDQHENVITVEGFEEDNSDQ